MHYLATSPTIPDKQYSASSQWHHGVDSGLAKQFIRVHILWHAHAAAASMNELIAKQKVQCRS